MPHPRTPVVPQAGPDAASRVQGSGEAASRGRGAPRRGIALTVLCFLVCCGLGLQSWTAMRLTGFDLGIFDQAVRAYAHFELPRSPIKNVHHEFPPGFSLLGDHFTPALALLAPLYWVWDDPRVLVFAQAALFAVGVPVVRRIARHCFAGADPRTVRRAADLGGLVYALGWPLLNASYNGFHEVAFAVPFTLLMLERGLAHRYGAAACWAALLCTAKEDMGLVVGAFGLVLAVRAHRAGHRTGRITGVGLALAGPLVSAVVISWFLPAMGGPEGYYWSYGSLGADPGAALAHVLTEPWVLLQVAVTPVVKVAMVAWILGTLALLPLGSPTFLLALPLLAERVLSDNPNHWPVINHYDAFLWPILLTAALETLGRLHRKWGILSRRWAIAGIALSSAAAVGLGLGLLVRPDFWQPSPDKRPLATAAELIPDGATVEVDNTIAPRLTARTHVVIADGTPRGADWFLLRVKDRTFPFVSTEDQRRQVELLLAHGYTRVWQEDGTVLLHRTTRTPIPGMRIPGPDSTPIREAVPGDVGTSLLLR
ncbi:DUF2079 domain-containing protein [Streptomyces sp. NBC_00572]|uniref:DUF2079 domain-containing protein n=1 Tax=Streptomyces sp. NBC_00572 TaxID=2903664 RepID=UPI00225137A6|nr:DUF2079 domain-containing protein [Streptomyces sp. NBC_00572]MCX4980968.1 DUF2079 domain-containing protein [Streptomyces sp. NBC_00572]